VPAVHGDADQAQHDGEEEEGDGAPPHRGWFSRGQVKRRSNSSERTHSMAWVAAVIGVWTLFAPWVVAGDVAHTRSITSNIITGVLATMLALDAAAGARDKQRTPPPASPYAASEPCPATISDHPPHGRRQEA
jgi:hypothetical protein